MAEPDSVNAQVFSFLHKDFLAVSATHGTAHLALFDQAMWDKYELATLAGPKFKTNTLIVAKPMPTAYSNEEDPKSVFGPAGDTIPALQDRGAVFLACHNAISEITAKLIARGTNPDHASHEAAAAELTNHLIDGIVLPPPESSQRFRSCSRSAFTMRREARHAQDPFSIRAPMGAAATVTAAATSQSGQQCRRRAIPPTDGC
jgi:hypothetical protein